MGALESCERIKTDVLRLHFDTIKRDKKERIYKVEEGLGQVSAFFLNEKGQFNYWIKLEFRYVSISNVYLYAWA